MVLYLITIFVGVALVSALNIFFNPLYQDGWWIYILFTLGFTVVAVIVDAIVAIVIRKMPERWFQEDKGIFKTSERELKFYRFLKVHKWKDFVPELGNFTGFHKNKVVTPFDNEYISRFILEARYGVAIHFYSVPASFLIILCDWRMYTGESNLWLTIALPVAIVNAILIVLPAFILKYNLPRLIAIYNNNIELEKRKKQAEK
jgi:hypothetical protein